MWSKTRVRFHFLIFCMYPVSSSPFVREAAPSILNGLGPLATNQLVIDVWVFSWTLNPIPLVYISILMPAPHHSLRSALLRYNWRNMYIMVMWHTYTSWKRPSISLINIATTSLGPFCERTFEFYSLTKLRLHSQCRKLCALLYIRNSGLM